LENGGMVSYRKLIDAMTTEKQLPLPIEFRVGCGLEPLQPGEADAIVLAGMGHLTMLEVLFGKQVDDGDQHQHNLDADNIRPVDRIHAKRIFLQPTNCRPQHMIELYDRMHGSGDWDLNGETIACVGGRYYINSYFERKQSGDPTSRFPGHFMSGDTLDQSRVYDSYVKHHLQWLKEDYERPKYMLEEEDRRWLEYISEAQENKDRWKNLVSWYSH
jgi:tRNA A22 N-methylase